MKKWLRRTSITKRMMLSYLVACLIPLLSVSAVIYRVSARSLEESSMEFASAFSSQVASGIDEFMDNYDQLTKLVLLDSRQIGRAHV